MDPARGTADTPDELARLVVGNARRAAERQRRRPWRDKFPAVVTAIDTGYSPPRYAWYEQAYDAAGDRVAKPGGRTGSATFSPAYAYGDGRQVGGGDLPYPTVLTRRLVAGALGAVYEFPVYCACVAGAGSGGSGTGYVLNACCPNPIPTTLHGTFSAAGCPCLDGLAVTFVFNPSSADQPWVATLPPTWCTTGTARFDSYQVWLECRCTGAGCDWVLFPSVTSGFSGIGNACRLQGTGSSLVSSCDPFHLQFSGISTVFLGAAACDCEGQPWTLTITE